MRDLEYMIYRTICSNMILHSGVGVRNSNFTQRRVPGESFRVKENFQVHHIVNDNLDFSLVEVWKVPTMRLTVKSVGSDVSQLRVQPTTLLKRPASNLAKPLTALIAVALVGLLI